MSFDPHIVSGGTMLPDPPPSPEFIIIIDESLDNTDWIFLPCTLQDDGSMKSPGSNNGIPGFFSMVFR